MLLHLQKSCFEHYTGTAAWRNGDAFRRTQEHMKQPDTESEPWSVKVCTLRTQMEVFHITCCRILSLEIPETELGTFCMTRDAEAHPSILGLFNSREIITLSGAFSNFNSIIIIIILPQWSLLVGGTVPKNVWNTLEWVSAEQWALEMNFPAVCQYGAIHSWGLWVEFTSY